MEMLTLTLYKSRDTKNKVVYGTTDDSVIQSVYIDKNAPGEDLSAAVGTAPRPVEAGGPSGGRN